MHGGVSLDVRVKELNLKFKQVIQSRGGIGIRSLGRIFRQFDNNGNKKLDRAEFEMALNQCGFFCAQQDMKSLMTYYDIDGDGNVSFDEFLRGLRDPLTERRRRMVDKAFFLMDKDGSG
jgi:Ca2+-binding EF-hand superfamily protein